MGWWLGTQPPAMPSVDGMRPPRLMDGARLRPSKCTAESTPSDEMLSNSSCVAWSRLHPPRRIVPRAHGLACMLSTVTCIRTPVDAPLTCGSASSYVAYAGTT